MLPPSTLTTTDSLLQTAVVASFPVTMLFLVVRPALCASSSVMGRIALTWLFLRPFFAPPRFSSLPIACASPFMTLASLGGTFAAFDRVMNPILCDCVELYPREGHHSLGPIMFPNIAIISHTIEALSSSTHTHTIVELHFSAVIHISHNALPQWPRSSPQRPCSSP